MNKRHTCPTCNGTIKFEGYECPMCEDGTIDDGLWIEWISVNEEQEQLRAQTEMNFARIFGDGK